MIVSTAVAAAGADGGRPRRDGRQRLDDDDRARHAHRSRDAATTAATVTSDLRSTLGRMLGEHAVLAMNATNLGVTGSKSFPAAAKALDRNSVELSKAIGSLYGADGGEDVPRRPFPVASAHRLLCRLYGGAREEGQGRPGHGRQNLKTYTNMHGEFLAGATGLPRLAVQNDLLGHVLELKDQLDAYAAGNYTKAADLYRDAYAHMFMTGDLLAGAIAKQKNLK